MAAPDVFDSVTSAAFANVLLQQVVTSQDGMKFLLETTRLGHQAMIDQRSAMAIQESRSSIQARETGQLQLAMLTPRQTAPSYVPEAVAAK